MGRITPPPREGGLQGLNMAATKNLACVAGGIVRVRGKNMTAESNCGRWI